MRLDKILCDRGGAVAWLCMVALTSCDGPEVRRGSAGALRPPAVLGVLSGASFGPSGVAFSPQDCDLILAGQTWGTLVRVRPTSTEEQVLARYSVPRTATRMSGVTDSTFWVRSHNPPAIERWAWWRATDTVPNNPLSFPVGRLSSGGRSVGPIVSVDDSLTIVAPLGDPRRALPREAYGIAPSSVPVADVIDSNGVLVGRVGERDVPEGEYVPWLAHRLALGMDEDTVVVVFLHDGRRVNFVRDWTRSDSVIFTSARSVDLPRYWETPPIEEDRFRVEWMAGGDGVKHLSVLPQLEEAFVAESGVVYAIRTYEAYQQDHRHALFGRVHSWVRVKQGVEVYDDRGVRILGIAIPEGQTAAWLAADRRGRMFLRFPERMEVWEDPTGIGGFCQTRFGHRMLSTNDSSHSRFYRPGRRPLN